LDLWSVTSGGTHCNVFIMTFYPFWNFHLRVQMLVSMVLVFVTMLYCNTQFSKRPTTELASCYIHWIWKFRKWCLTRSFARKIQ
jgi:hypothetical protein